MDSANLTRDGSGCLGIVEFFQITGATHGVDWTCRGRAGLDAKTEGGGEKEEDASLRCSDYMIYIKMCASRRLDDLICNIYIYIYT